MSDITFAILSFNHPEHTARAVRSVRSFANDDQILLLHNGSRAEVETQLRAKFETIRHISINDNRGFTGGANELLRAGFLLSKWVLFITNDCELIQLSDSWPEQAGIYAPTIYRRSTAKIDSIGGTFAPLTGKLKHLRKPLSVSERFWSERLGRELYVPGTAFLIDRNTWLELVDLDQNIFDESLHTYWEDVDLSMRAHQKDIRIGIWPQIEFVHKVGKTCHKDPFYTRYLFQRNRRIVSARYVRSWLRPLQNRILGAGPDEASCST